MKRQELTHYLEELLHPGDFEDYLPNGLQVEGRQEVARVALAVTASRYAVERAVQMRADALIVHHGWFWKSEPRTVTGVRAARLRPLMAGDVNLFAYHLPLDAHPEIGNNSVLGRLLKARDARPLKPGSLLWTGAIAPVSSDELAAGLEGLLGRKPLVVGPAQQGVERIAWCTGAAQDFLLEAADAGVQAYVSGEVSERTTHEAREAGVTYLACGHHATETLGIRALGDRLAAQLPLETFFIDEDNPV